MNQKIDILKRQYPKYRKMLRITDTNDSFEITIEETRILELKLNISLYGNRWSHIGDELFNYRDCEDKVLTVTTDQYMFLKMLFTT